MPLLLSKMGSSRATRYVGNNTVVTVDGRTHFVWSDYDRSVENIEEVRSGEDQVHRRVHRVQYAYIDGGEPPLLARRGLGLFGDNHTVGAITINSVVRDGVRKHYPNLIIARHHDEHVHHLANALDGREDGWAVVQSAFTHAATYPSAIADSSGRVHVVYRGKVREFVGLYYQSRMFEDPAGHSTPVLLACRDRQDGYRNYQHSLTTDDRGGLHLLMEHSLDGPAPSFVAYMRSTDGGRTWQSASGETLDLPAMAESRATFIAIRNPAVPVYIGNVVCDGRTGYPYAVVRIGKDEPARVYPGCESATSFHYVKAGDRTLVGTQLTACMTSDGVLVVAGIDDLGHLAYFHSADGGEHFTHGTVLKKPEHREFDQPKLERRVSTIAVDRPWIMFSTYAKADKYPYLVYAQKLSF